MAILTRKAIREEIEKGSIKIDPFDESRLGVNSYDLTLSDQLKIYTKNFDGTTQILDPTRKNKMKEIAVRPSGCILSPGTLYLAQVNERIWSDKFVFELTGRSSLARLGITVHETAGFSNIGHDFKYVLEISVIHPVKIYPGMAIAQIFVHTTVGESEDYSGHYVDDQKGSEIAEAKPI